MIMLLYLPIQEMSFPIYRTFLLTLWPVQLMAALSVIGILFGATAARRTGNVVGRLGAIINFVIIFVLILDSLFHVFLRMTPG